MGRFSQLLSSSIPNSDEDDDTEHHNSEDAFDDKDIAVNNDISKLL